MWPWRAWCTRISICTYYNIDSSGSCLEMVFCFDHLIKSNYDRFCWCLQFAWLLVFRCGVSCCSICVSDNNCFSFSQFRPLFESQFVNLIIRNWPNSSFNLFNHVRFGKRRAKLWAKQSKTKQTEKKQHFSNKTSTDFNIQFGIK